MYVPKHKFLGGYFAPWISLNVANGSLVGDIRGGNLSLNGGGAGFADTLVAPLYMGWHFKRADVSAGYAFFAPTGRYTFGASDNVGSGYWGNDLISGTTAYLTKNKGTSANLFIDWEHHGMKRGTNETPGQTFTTEWGLGQALPLDKDVHKLLQLGFVGYDQWQVSDNGGTISNVPARLIPHYSVHAIGVQTNFIAPQRGLSFFFNTTVSSTQAPVCWDAPSSLAGPTHSGFQSPNRKVANERSLEARAGRLDEGTRTDNLQTE